MLLLIDGLTGGGFHLLEQSLQTLLLFFLLLLLLNLHHLNALSVFEFKSLKTLALAIAKLKVELSGAGETGFSSIRVLVWIGIGRTFVQTLVITLIG